MDNDFILDRVNEGTASLKENKEYITKENAYTKLTYDFFKTLTEEQIVQFDTIIDLVGDMQKDELILAYQTAIEDVKKEFNVPYYVFEEVVEYYQRGKPISRRDNAIALINLAKLNNRLTETQAQVLKDLCK